MRFIVDTEAKTIETDRTVNLGEFVEQLEKFVPMRAWKDYTLESANAIYYPTVSRPIWGSYIVSYPDGTEGVAV